MGGNIRHPTSLPSPPDSSHHGDSVQYSSFVCPNCKEKKWRQKMVSKDCSRKFLSTFFVVVIPTSFWIMLTVNWFVICKQTLEELEKNKKNFQERTIQAGKLILSLNLEREITATFLTARSEETRSEAKYDLDMARSKTDAILNSFYAWPGTMFEQRQQEQDQLFRSSNSTSSSSGATISLASQSIFRSRHLFLAYLNGHRSQIHAWSYFCDEIQFYTDLIDSILVWINRGNSPFSISFPPSATSLFPSLLSLSDDISQLQEAGEYARLLLQSHSYLMSSLNYLGAEQALCSVYHSVVCLSRRETLYYANFSFAAEAFFRFYRQSLPPAPPGNAPNQDQSTEEEQTASFDQPSSASSGNSPWRWSGPGIPREWRTADHRLFFPNLHVCRRELVSELDYAIMTGGLNDGEFQPPISENLKNKILDGLSATKSKGSGPQSAEHSNSPCSYNRKNETKLFDTDLITEHELNRVLSSLKSVVDSIDQNARQSRNFITIFLVSMCLYLTVAHVIRGIYFTINASKKRKRASKARSVVLRREQQTEGSSGAAPLLLVMRNRESSPKPEVVSNHHQNYQRQSSTTFDNEFASPKKSTTTTTTTINTAGQRTSYHHMQDKKPDHPKQVRIMEAKDITISRAQPLNKSQQLHQHQQQSSNQLKLPPAQCQQQPPHSLLQTIRETEHFSRQLNQQQQQQQQQAEQQLQSFTPLLQISGVLAPNQNAQNAGQVNEDVTVTSINNFVAGYKIATV